MEKLLVISGSIFGEVVAGLVKKEEFEVITSNHQDAIFVIASEEPTHIFICECGEGQIGEETFINIKMSVTNQKILRCGFSRADNSNYFQLPISLAELEAKLRK